MTLRKIFCRIGSKAPIASTIISMIPPHEVYVEPFVGSGAIYFKKPPSDKEVLNDKDSDLMSAYKFIKRAKNEDLDKYNKYDTDEKLEAFYKSEGGTYLDKLAKYIIRSCWTFGSKGVGKIYTKSNSNPFQKLENLDKYKERVKATIFLNQDYKTVIKKYDSPESFIYLDPPYEEKSDKLYKHSLIDYEEMALILKKIKGKFLLSLNDSPNIRNLFDGFRIKTITVKPVGNAIDATIGSTARRELLISNY